MTKSTCCVRIVRTSLLVGVGITLVGAALSFLLPQAETYLFAPGMLAVYISFGGVHGNSTGVHLPSVATWYALATIVNVFFYTLVAFVTLELFCSVREKKSVL